MSLSTKSKPHDEVVSVQQSQVGSGSQPKQRYVEVGGLKLTVAQYEYLQNYKRPDDLTPATVEEIKALFEL